MPTKEIKSLLKGRENLVYGRVSGKEQTGTLKTQVENLKTELAKMGVKRVKVFQEQVSGTKRLDERPALRELVEYALAKGEGKTAIVVRDTQRISRDPWIVGRIYDPLRELDIPLVSFANGGLIASTDKTPQPAGDLLMPILVSIGGQEIQVGKERTIIGTKAAAKKGIFAGTPLSLYPKDAVNPWAELARFVPLMAEGTLSGAEAARRLGKSTSWIRKSRARLNEIREMGVLDEWLNVIDMIREMEIKNGEGFGKGATRPMRAVRRMTGGYIDSPKKFSAPTMDDLNEYFTNWKSYQPKRTK